MNCVSLQADDPCKHLNLRFRIWGVPVLLRSYIISLTEYMDKIVGFIEATFECNLLDGHVGIAQQADGFLHFDAHDVVVGSFARNGSETAGKLVPAHAHVFGNVVNGNLAPLHVAVDIVAYFCQEFSVGSRRTV